MIRYLLGQLNIKIIALILCGSLLFTPTILHGEQNQLRFLDTVKINGEYFSPEMYKIIQSIILTSPETVDGYVWITSAWRPEKNSKHSQNHALDVRVKNVKGFDMTTFMLNKVVAEWARRIQANLGDDYDVIYGVPGHYNHIHCEYDPLVK